MCIRDRWYQRRVHGRDLEQGWEGRKKEIKLRLMRAEAYTPILQTFIKKLEQALLDEKKSRKVVWIGYRLIDEESKRLTVKYEVAALLPEDIVFLDSHLREVLEAVEQF
eukprot:TRINITY_DN9148_c0_g1_i5.p2 TRINITY_DN9148_c0_g1~~TRINITY_DN9148_c0_g1_i5.p2  ORF type:complete len:109 (+),score=22.36 TRINITY_DN9148_c0_g1_i5:64-390(+)